MPMNSAILMLEAAAARWGDKCALRDEEERLTFRDLRRRALSISAGLAAAGGEGLRPVVVYLPKSAAAVACFAGAMYTGDRKSTRLNSSH